MNQSANRSANQSVGASPHNLYQDIRMALKPGLLTGGIMSLYPLILFFWMLHSPGEYLDQVTDIVRQTATWWGGYHPNGLFATVDPAFAENFYRVYYYGLPALGMIVGSFCVGYVLGRQTGRIRPSILAALLANILFLVACTAWITMEVFAVDDPQLDYISALLPVALRYAGEHNIPLFEIAFFSIGLLGWFGARLGAGAIREAKSSATADQVARSYQLGDLVKIYPAAAPSSAFLLVLGGIALLFLLFVVERAVLPFSGTSVATDFFEGVIGLVGLLVITIRRRGQDVYVYQQGVVGYTSLGKLGAIPWEGSSLRYQENALRIVGKHGVSLKVLRNIDGFDELNTLAQQKISQKSYALRV
jgi:hypothetical protein